MGRIPGGAAAGVEYPEFRDIIKLTKKRQET